MTETTTTDTERTPVDHDRRLIRGLVVATAIFLVALGAVAFIAGFPALYAVGRDWLGLPGFVAVLYPVGVDVGIVVLSLASLAGKALRLRVWPMAAGVGFLVIMSAGLQVAHVIALGHPNLLPTVAGAVAGASLPGLLWLSANSLERVLFSPAVDRAAATRPARRPATRAAASTAVRPASKPAPAVATRPRPATAIAPAVRAAAVQRVTGGESQRAVAADLGVSRAAIQAWLREPAAA